MQVTYDETTKEVKKEEIMLAIGLFS